MLRHGVQTRAAGTRRDRLDREAATRREANLAAAEVNPLADAVTWPAKSLR
jgi:hypothetical protein